MAASGSLCVDDYVDDIVAKKGRHVYKEGLSEKDWRKEIESVPLFMTESPAEGAEVSDDLAALQALKFEDSTPEGRAACFKDDGNDFFKKKLYRDAILAYTEGLKEKVDEEHIQLRVTLLSNRAASQYRLGNNRTALEDCKRAIVLNPKHLKALIKGSEACHAMHHHKDTLTWCDKTLSVDPGNSSIIKIRHEAAKLLELEERDARRAARDERKRLQAERKLEEAIQSRGITLSADPKVRYRFEEHKHMDEEERGLSSLTDLEHSIPENPGVQLADDGSLSWPVLFVYPEHHQTDFIQAFHETSSFSDHAAIMFGTPAPWDSDHLYKPGCISIYYEDTCSGHLVHISPDQSLLSVLSDKRYVVRAGTAIFIILVAKSAFEKTFLKLYPS